MDLGETPCTGVLQKARLTGPMARISHIVILTELNHFSKEINDYLKQSYNRVAAK
jgi:hypothetical protein